MQAIYMFPNYPAETFVLELHFYSSITWTAYLGTKPKILFIGDVIHNAGPHRDKKLKHYIPEVVYTGVYPPYAGGGGFLYSGHLALRLYNVTDRVLLYPIDDVYTGMCLQKLGLAPERHKGFRTFDIEEKSRSNICPYVDWCWYTVENLKRWLIFGLGCRVLI